METENLFDDVPWEDIIPTCVKIPIQAYKHRQIIHSWWKRLVHFSGQGNTDIVITGRSAVGKSVLNARLRGMTEDLAWDLPDVSRDVESGVIRIADWARIVSVIPGQTSRERDKGIHEAFNSHECLEGVIHVVDWGYTPERDHTILKKRIEEEGLDSIEKWREFNLDLELKEFRKTCDRIRESYSRTGRPKWMLIAANKCDLYPNDLGKAEHYYHPETDSEFSKIISDFHSHVGKNHVRCMSVPVSSWDKDFEWNGETMKSDIGGTTESRVLFRHFIYTISGLAAGSGSAM